MVKLNLPECTLKTREEFGKTYVLDILRRKYVLLTPEEWVRQHFLHFMIDYLGYSKGLFKIEKSLRYNRKLKRADIQFCKPNGDPLVLVECKAPNQPINQEVFNQAAVYNKELNARISIITNGLKHFCYETDFSTHQINFLDKIPSYQMLTAD